MAAVAHARHGLPDGPFFEDLTVAQTTTSAGLTLTSGHVALHQSIVGDRMPLFTDAALCHQVTGQNLPLAHPALVWDVSIGQSTALTRRVVANLYYRGLVFHRYPSIGDTLTTTTTVRGLRQNTAKPGRAATGMAALEVSTVDQHGRAVLNFLRCAMLPMATDHDTDRLDDVEALAGPPPPAGGVGEAVSGWRWHGVDRDNELVTGEHRTTQLGDVVSSAPELARLTMNVAAVHHDARAASGQRLVYGGHTIGLAAAQTARMFPSLLTIVAWDSCRHVAPVHEQDILTSESTVEDVVELARGGRLVRMFTQVDAYSSDSGGRRVLEWRYQAVAA